MKFRSLLITMVVTLGSIGPAPAHGAELPPIREAVFFGDSLTDAGTFGMRFTTAAGKTWAQHVAERYAQSALPNEHVPSYADAYKGMHASPGPGGLNYAEGGARAAQAYSPVSDDPEGAPVSATVQLRHFLAQHGSFGRDQIVMLYVGTNDVAYDYDPIINASLAAALRAGTYADGPLLRAARARVATSADDTVRLVGDMLRSGAQRLVVFTLPDLGNLPWFRTAASRAYVSGLTRVFNQHLLEGLPKDPRILVIDMQTFLRPLLAHPQQYGFKHAAHADACREPEQDFCDADSLAAPDAAQSYVFAASEHFTTRTHELLATHVQQEIAKHSWQ